MKDRENQIEAVLRFMDTPTEAKKIAELLPSDIVSYDGKPKGQHLYIEQKMEIAKEIMKQGSVVLTREEYEHLKAKSTRIPIDKDGDFIEYAVYDTDRVLSKPEYRDYVHNKASNETVEKYSEEVAQFICKLFNEGKIHFEQKIQLLRENEKIAKEFCKGVKE